MPIDISIGAGPGKGKGGSGGTGPGTGTPVKPSLPRQIAGLVAMEDCGATECRPDQCWCNYVYATVGSTKAAYDNDFSSFIVDHSLAAANPGTVTWLLDRYDYQDQAWENITLLVQGSHGTLYSLGSISGHPTYSQYIINWARVLAQHGAGTYRIRVEFVIDVGMDINVGCLASMPFCLRPWHCDRVNGTVKFETYLDGMIGDINKAGSVFDLCGMNAYDSIRFPGFFGFASTPEYLEVLHEYPSGQIRRVRDEAIQQYELVIHPVPKWLSDRFKIYGLMSDRLLVSDYNHNNSDYDIRGREVIRAGSFEPEWYDRHDLRRGSAVVLFRDGIQSVIKSHCCDQMERPD